MRRHKTELASDTQRWQALAFLCAVVLAALSVSSAALAAGAAAVPRAPDACAPLSSAGQIPAATVITFDDLPAGTSIGSAYQRTHGVRFEDGRTARVIAYDHPLPRSAPMVAMSQTDGDPASVALNFYFDTAQTHVGMFLGNGGGVTTARLEGFDVDGNLICADEVANVPDGHTAFIGLRDDLRTDRQCLPDLLVGPGGVDGRPAPSATAAALCRGALRLPGSGRAWRPTARQRLRLPRPGRSATDAFLPRQPHGA